MGHSDCDISSTFCCGENASLRRDCDRDVFYVCHSENGCDHKRIVKDVDGDFVYICTRM